MVNFLVLTLVVLILGAALLYIHKEKKKGIRCIGCPDSKTCSGNCAGCAGNCSGHIDK